MITVKFLMLRLVCIRVQVSALLLFAIVMEAISREFRVGLPWKLLYVGLWVI